MTKAAMLLHASVTRLHMAFGDCAIADVRRIFEHHLGAQFDPDMELNGAQIAQIEKDIAARARHQPVAQIIGQRAFWDHIFTVTSDVLDPRADTETLIETALGGPVGASVLDLGTGSGCILLSLLAHWPRAIGLGVDQSTRALDVARQNAMRLGLGDRAKWMQSDWLCNVSGCFDLIVSNPPYIAAAIWADLDPEVCDWEPKAALCSGPTGLEAYQAIMARISAHMYAHTRVLFEIGYDQADAVIALARENGLNFIHLYHDINAKPRVVELGAP